MAQGEYRIIRGGRETKLPDVKIIPALDAPLLKITDPPAGVPALWEIELDAGKMPVGRSIASTDISKQPDNSIILTGKTGGLVLNAKPLEVLDTTERMTGEFSPLEHKVLAAVGLIYKDLYDEEGNHQEVYDVLKKTTREEFYAAAHRLPATKRMNLKDAFDSMEVHLAGEDAREVFAANEISKAFAFVMEMGDQVIPTDD